MGRRALCAVLCGRTSADRAHYQVVTRRASTTSWDEFLDRDLNGDQKLDVVVANNGSSNLNILLGNGDGSFQTTMSTTLSGTQPTAVILADFNSDQKFDFATADLNGNSVSVKLGNGNGGFGVGSTLLGVTAPMDLVAGDVNGNYGSTYIGWGAATSRRSNHEHRDRSAVFRFAS